MRRIWAAAIVAVLGAAAVIPAAAGQVTANKPPGTPSYAGDFPDPAVLWDAATARYWAYATQNGTTTVQVMSSPTLDPPSWSPVGNALPTLPAWATPGFTWAPSVAQFGTTWVMWYTTRQASSGRQCLSVATASQPGGPFTDSSTAPAICQVSTDGGSIDGNIFFDGTTPYLIWKSDDNAIGKLTHLWGAPLDRTGTAPGAWTQLLTADASWQSGIVEGPNMVASGGAYYLFYGASSWNSTGAGIGYATCRRPLGPCRDRTMSGPWLGSYGSGATAALGPAGPNVFRDASNALRFAYHAWLGGVGYPAYPRALWIAHLSFASGGPTLSP